MYHYTYVLSYLASVILFLKKLFLNYIHWYFACFYVCVRKPNTLKLEFQTNVSCHMGAGIDPGPSGGAASAFNHRAVSLVLQCNFFDGLYHVIAPFILHTSTDSITVCRYRHPLWNRYM